MKDDQWEEVPMQVKTLGDDADRKAAGLIKH